MSVKKPLAPLPLPDEIKVGFRSYRVFLHAEELAGPDGPAVGQCRHNASEIHVATSQPPREIANTLLHEIMHGIWDVYTLGETVKNDEESIVNCLTNGLCGVIRDNPGLAKWFAAVLED